MNSQNIDLSPWDNLYTYYIEWLLDIVYYKKAVCTRRFGDYILLLLSQMSPTSRIISPYA
jgi:hypothetical protein